MVQQNSYKSDDSNRADGENCSVCRDLLASLERFFDLIETARRSHTSDWLTVDEVAGELKISKSIVYRLIRNGELEAVDLVVGDGKASLKGHYRVKRSSLKDYLDSRRVQPPPGPSTHRRPRRHPEVQNHLGL